MTMMMMKKKMTTKKKKMMMMMKMKTMIKKKKMMMMMTTKTKRTMRMMMTKKNRAKRGVYDLPQSLPQKRDQTVWIPGKNAQGAKDDQSSSAIDCECDRNTRLSFRLAQPRWRCGAPE